jgi:hypothetical protein
LWSRAACVTVRAMRTTVLVMLVLAACKREQATTTKRIDCAAFMAHIDDIAKQAIASLPEDRRAAAEQRRIQGRDAVERDCHEHPGESEWYRCAMKATTVAAFRACHRS